MKLVLVLMLTNALLKKRIVIRRLIVKTQAEVTNAVVTRATTEMVKFALKASASIQIVQKIKFAVPQAHLTANVKLVTLLKVAPTVVLTMMSVHTTILIVRSMLTQSAKIQSAATTASVDKASLRMEENVRNLWMFW